MDYLKISYQELQKYPNQVKSINALFSPEAKYLGKAFSVGAQKRIFYGQPAIMIGNSDLLASIGDWSGDVELATSIELTDDNIKGFIITWLLINNLFPFEYEWEINDAFITKEWIDYFGYNNKKYIDELEDHIKSEFMFMWQNYSPVDNVIKPIIEKRYKMALENCTADLLQLGSNQQCINASEYGTLLGIDTLDNWLMYYYGVGTNDFFNTIGNRDLKDPLEDVEKKYINLGLDRAILEDKVKPINWISTQNNIRVAAKLVGRENDPGVVKILSNPGI